MKNIAHCNLVTEEYSVIVLGGESNHVGVRFVVPSNIVDLSKTEKILLYKTDQSNKTVVAGEYSNLEINEISVCLAENDSDYASGTIVYRIETAGYVSKNITFNIAEAIDGVLDEVYIDYVNNKFEIKKVIEKSDGDIDIEILSEYIKKDEVSRVGKTGRYSDLLDEPTKISEFENDAKYLTSYTETDPTVPSYVKAITEADINNWNTKSNFSGKYSDLTGIPSEFKPSSHKHKMSDITDYQEPDLSGYALKSEIPTDYLTEIPSEYITETELNQAIENMASGVGIQEITTDTNIFDLETGIYYVAEGVNLTYTEWYADSNPPISVTTKSILNVVKKIVSETEGYVYYTLTTLNSEVDPTHYSPIGTYHGFIARVDLFVVRWLGGKPNFVSEDTINTEPLTDEEIQEAINDVF